MTDGDPAVAVAAGVFVQRSQQASLRAVLRQLRVIRYRHITPCVRGRIVDFNRHLVHSPRSGFAEHAGLHTSPPGILRGFFLHHAVEEIDLLGLFRKRYDRLFPRGCVSLVTALPAELAADIDRIDLFNFYAKAFQTA